MGKNKLKIYRDKKNKIQIEYQFCAHIILSETGQREMEDLIRSIIVMIKVRNNISECVIDLNKALRLEKVRNDEKTDAD